MDFRMNRKLLTEIHNSTTTSQIVGAVAQEHVPRVAAETPRDSGETAAGTHAETDHRSANGKSVAARIVQDRGAPLPTQFGNSKVRASRQFDRGMSGTLQRTSRRDRS